MRIMQRKMIVIKHLIQSKPELIINNPKGNRKDKKQEQHSKIRMFHPCKKIKHKLCQKNIRKGTDDE